MAASAAKQHERSQGGVAARRVPFVGAIEGYGVRICGGIKLFNNNMLSFYIGCFC